MGRKEGREGGRKEGRKEGREGILMYGVLQVQNQSIYGWNDVMFGICFKKNHVAGRSRGTNERRLVVF